MKANFRQGIMTAQRDSANQLSHLIKTSTGVTFSAADTKTVLNFAHGTENYLHEESVSITDAWPLPTSPSGNSWLYWDINLKSGKRTHVTTDYQPIVSLSKPQNVPEDQHWFDKSKKKMRVFKNGRWIPKVRVCAGRFASGQFFPEGLGSQVGLNNISIRAGKILYAHETYQGTEAPEPLKRFNMFGHGSFIHTESALSSQFSKLVNLRLELQLDDATACEPIPKYSVIAYKGVEGEICLADKEHPEWQSIGVAHEEFSLGETRTYTKHGQITNQLWNFQKPAGSWVFLDSNGEIVDTPPGLFSITAIGVIVSPTTILLDIQRSISLMADDHNNIIPLAINSTTGRLVAVEGNTGTGGGTGGGTATGFTHTQLIPSTTWNVIHNKNTPNLHTQVQDNTGSKIIPEKIQIVDGNTVVILFNTPVSGKAKIIFYEV
jgi:hypothetical protein